MARVSLGHRYLNATEFVSKLVIATMNMNIYVSVENDKPLPQTLHAFTSEHDLNVFMQIYEVKGTVVPVEFEYHPEDLRNLGLDWPVQIYYAATRRAGVWEIVRAFSNYAQYSDFLLKGEGFEYLDGTLDGFKKSLKQGKCLFSVTMRSSGEIGKVARAECFRAIELVNSELSLHDVERGKSGANRGYNMADGPYFIYVHANDSFNAQEIATPLLEFLRQRLEGRHN